MKIFAYSFEAYQNIRPWPPIMLHHGHAALETCETVSAVTVVSPLHLQHNDHGDLRARQKSLPLSIDHSRSAAGAIRFKCSLLADSAALSLHVICHLKHHANACIILLFESFSLSERASSQQNRARTPAAQVPADGRCAARTMGSIRRCRPNIPSREDRKCGRASTERGG